MDIVSQLLEKGPEWILATILLYLLLAERKERKESEALMRESVHSLGAVVSELRDGLREFIAFAKGERSHG